MLKGINKSDKILELQSSINVHFIKTVLVESWGILWTTNKAFYKQCRLKNMLWNLLVCCTHRFFFQNKTLWSKFCFNVIWKVNTKNCLIFLIINFPSNRFYFLMRVLSFAWMNLTYKFINVASSDDLSIKFYLLSLNYDSFLTRSIKLSKSTMHVVKKAPLIIGGFK